MKVTKVKTTTFEMNDGFMIDIVDDINTFHAWIYKKTIGVKFLMFGVPADQQTMDEFIDIVLNNVPDYEEAYNDSGRGYKMDKIISIRFKETELPILNNYIEQLEKAPELTGIKIDATAALKRALLIAASRDPVYNKKTE